MKTIDVLNEVLFYWKDEKLIDFLTQFDCEPEDLKQILTARKKLKEEDAEMEKFIFSITGEDDDGKPHLSYHENGSTSLQKGNFRMRPSVAAEIKAAVEKNEQEIRQRIDALSYTYLKNKYNALFFWNC